MCVCNHTRLLSWTEDWLQRAEVRTQRPCYASSPSFPSIIFFLLLFIYYIIAALIAAFISAHCGCTHLTVRMLSPVLTVIIASHTAWHRELASPCGRPEVRGRARVKICCGNGLAMQQLATAETPAVCCREGRREGGRDGFISHKNNA